ncbi:hypothetical protein GCM10017668_15190 [Streptomyces tuirus]|uniref:Uncharacterized protein n=1 Tax=Streptomyces tuirus TaxID=68278 RepID=A0A7G1ND90_9ACTN|nr:hypothetical protein GCM10017668_15190 [Streptomyces tuirus]
MEMPCEDGGFGCFEGAGDAFGGFGAFFPGVGVGVAGLGEVLEVLGAGEVSARSAPGFSVPSWEGVAKEIRPPGAEPLRVVGSAARDSGSPDSLSITVMAVTHAVIVARASVPASQSRRVPGARVVSGAQPLSQGRSCGGRDLLSDMRGSSGGAPLTAAQLWWPGV